ncbi:MAG: hypothetical protein AB1714_08705 [Acidobacteriota bacterium]
MPMFVAVTPNTEVNGETVNSVVEGMGAFRAMALDILAKNGISNPKPGQWYSQQSWLNAFKDISIAIGPNTLYSIGLAIPENAKFPPQIDSIHKGLDAINVAYHMNHRINGRVLFDQTTGKMYEGIGHYKYERLGDREAKMVCPNPYPCDFDRGIINGIAMKFRPAGSMLKVMHNDAAPCRKKGAESCEYKITW